jgi:hypothetical protein
MAGEGAGDVAGRVVAAARPAAGRVYCWCVRIRLAAIILVCAGCRAGCGRAAVEWCGLWRGARGESCCCRSTSTRRSGEAPATASRAGPRPGTEEGPHALVHEMWSQTATRMTCVRPEYI